MNYSAMRYQVYAFLICSCCKHDNIVALESDINAIELYQPLHHETANNLDNLMKRNILVLKKPREEHQKIQLLRGYDPKHQDELYLCHFSEPQEIERNSYPKVIDSNGYDITRSRYNVCIQRQQCRQQTTPSSC